MCENPGLLIKLFISEFNDNDFDDEFLKMKLSLPKFGFKPNARECLLFMQIFNQLLYLG